MPLFAPLFGVRVKGETMFGEEVKREELEAVYEGLARAADTLESLSGYVQSLSQDVVHADGYRPMLLVLAALRSATSAIDAALECAERLGLA